MDKFPKDVGLTKLHEKAQDRYFVSCLYFTKKSKWKYQLMLHCAQAARWEKSFWEEDFFKREREISVNLEPHCVWPLYRMPMSWPTALQMLWVSQSCSLSTFLLLPEMIKSHSLGRGTVLTTVQGRGKGRNVTHCKARSFWICQWDQGRFPILIQSSAV